MNATTTVMVFLVAAVLLAGTTLYLIYKLLCLMTMIIYGLDSQLSMIRSTYCHGIYGTQGMKLLLDDLEDRTADKIQSALGREDYENASHYREIAHAISQMKQLTNEEIENNE